MNERDIAVRLVPTLRSENDPRSLVATQRDLCWRESRIDVLVVNGSLSGFEIKSSRDSLARLPRQVGLYSPVLDYATLVCASSHVDQVADVIPSWWGVWKVVTTDEDVAFERIRLATPNPLVSAYAVARLLSYDELFYELRHVRGLDRLSRLRKTDMALRLLDVARPDEVRRVVRQNLLQRPSWRAAGQQP